MLVSLRQPYTNISHPDQLPESRRRPRRTRKPALLTTIFLSCAHDSVSVLPHPCRPVSNFTPAPSSTPSTFSGGPTRKIPALMSLQLTKPVGYSFVLNYVQGRIAKANAAKAALDKAGTAQGPSQDKACATPFKAKVVCATPGTSILVTK